MKTIEPSNSEVYLHRGKRPPHKHRWGALGAHTLHAGHKPKGTNPYPDRRMPIREIRVVFQCAVCKKLKVSIRHELVIMQNDKTTPKNEPSTRVRMECWPDYPESPARKALEARKARRAERIRGRDGV